MFPSTFLQGIDDIGIGKKLTISISVLSTSLTMSIKSDNVSQAHTYFS